MERKKDKRKKAKKEKKNKEEDACQVQEHGDVADGVTRANEADDSPNTNKKQRDVADVTQENEEADNSLTTNKKHEDNEESSVAEPKASKKRRQRTRKRKKEHEDTTNNNNDAKKAPDEEGIIAADEKKSAEVDRTVYVEGIPFAAVEDDVRQFFIDGGCSDITDLRLPVWHDTGRLRGYGHVVFESSCQRALTLSGQYLQGRYLTIQPAHKPKQQLFGSSTTDADTAEPSKVIVLHNLSYNALEEDVEDVLKSYGTIAPGGVRVVRHSGSEQSKGFGYVEFEEMESAIKVMNDSKPIVILGRHCRIDYDHGRVRGSFRTADRKLWHKEHKKSRPS